MRKLVSLVILVLFIAGCATEGQRLTAEGIAAGAIGGAAAGAALGQAIGGDTESTLLGGITGAVIGAIIGHSYADGVAERKAQLVGKENDLMARIQYARAANRDTLAYNTQLEKKIAKQGSKIENLVDRINRNEVAGSEHKKKKQELQQQLAVAKKNLQLAETELADLKNFHAQKSSDELDNEIKKLEKAVVRLKRNTRALASISRRI